MLLRSLFNQTPRSTCAGPLNNLNVHGLATRNHCFASTALRLRYPSPTCFQPDMRGITVARPQLGKHLGCHISHILVLVLLVDLGEG